MRQNPEFFGELELDLVYMARRLREAVRLEKLLTEAGIDYAVETGSYSAGFLIQRELTGAYFYVSPNDLVQAQAILVANRYKPYERE